MYLALYPKARLKAYALGIGAFYLKMRWALLYWLSLPFLLNALEGNSLPQNPYGTALAVPPHFAIHAGFLLLGAVLALLFRKKWPLPSNASSPLQINSSEARHSSKEEDFIQEIEAVQKKSQEITQWLYQDPKKGRDAYLKFSQEYPYFVLEPDSQLECAYSLYETGEEASAREALEQYLSHYPQGPYLGDVHLLLGKIYSQIPFLLEEAQTHLESALSRLEEGSARQEAQKTLRKIHKILNKIRETALKNDEPCVILCQNMKVKKIERIAQIIEFFNHTPLAHTLNFLQRTKGVIATNIPSDKALLAEKVIQDETKTPVLVVSESLLGKLPERYAIEEIEISKEALRFIGKSQVFYRSFADIQLVGVTQLHEAKGPQVTQQDSLVFDFFVFNPRLHFQMIDGVFRHSKNPQETGKLITPKKYATLFKRYGKSIPNNLGLSILADRGDWSEVTFLSKEDHEWYYRWLLYLLSPPSKKPPTKTLPLPIPGVLV
jgi:tetratricopeptide (TPR) repeat protein